MSKEKQNETNRDWIADHVDPNALIADGFDASIIGYSYCDSYLRVVYDAESMAQTLVADGCTYEEAQEYLEFNTFCAYVGENTPIYIYRLDEMMDKQKLNGKFITKAIAWFIATLAGGVWFSTLISGCNI